MLPTIRHSRPLRIGAPNFKFQHIVRLQAQRPRPLTSHIHCLPAVPSSPGTRPSLPGISPRESLHLRSRAWASSKPPIPPKGIDRAAEKELANKILEARPSEVSTGSSVRHVFEQSQAPPDTTPDITASLKGDFEVIKDTFALNSVPREAYALGLSGTLPYLATSLSTVYLSWNINAEWPAGSQLLNSILINPETAAHWLQVLEPIQVGYGAVIISFLGAIHWGLELAEKNPSYPRTTTRYAIGVLAPAVAWPTIFMPIEWALTTQFTAFLALYFTDSRVTVKGWVPAWYATYRFVLTAIVGVAIFLSLLGRAKVGDGHARLSTSELKDSLDRHAPRTDRYRNWEKEEAEERVRISEEKKREKKKQEEERAKREEQEKKKNQKKTGDKPEEKEKGGEKKDGEKPEGKQKSDEKEQKKGGEESGEDATKQES